MNKDQLDTMQTLELYKIYRAYVEHEDSLVNSRMAWFTASQAVLIGAYAVIVQRILVKPELLYNLTISDILKQLGSFYSNANALAAISIALLGVVSANGARQSINAATSAIRELRIKWERDIVGPNDHPFLPRLTGGGNETAQRQGFNGSTFLPRIAILIWIIIAIVHTVVLK